MQKEEIVSNYQNKHLLSTPFYTDLAGGLNTRVSPAQMAINQSQVAENIVYNVASGAVSARDGTVRHIMEPIPLLPAYGLYNLIQAKFSKGFRFLAIGGDPTHLVIHSNAYPTAGWTQLTDRTVAGVPVARRCGVCFYNDALVVVDGVNPWLAVTYTGAAPAVNDYFPSGMPSQLAGVEFLVVYNNRIYGAGSNSSQLSWSDQLGVGASLGALPDFPSANQISPGGVTDGDPVMGLAVAYGHLIVFKRNAIYAVSESDGNPTITQIARSNGLVAKFGFCNAENSVWFFGPSGVYSIGSDLTPQYESDYVLPDYSEVITGLGYDYESYGGVDVPSINHPTFGYNQAKQQVWVSCFKSTEVPGPRNRVFVHDMINKDATGRAAISNHVFYQDTTRNYTPIAFCEAIDEETSEPRFLSASRKVEAADVVINGGIANPYYVYLHDVPLEKGSLGDDGNLVEFQWQSKFLHLGDPQRLKVLRFYTIYADPRDEESTAYTNQNYTTDPVAQRNVRHAVLPVALKGAASVYYGGYIFVFGGEDVTGTYSRDIYRYDIAAGTWLKLSAQLGAAGLAYAQAVCSAYNGLIYLFGGSSNSSTALDTVQTISAAFLAANTFTTPTTLPGKLKYAHTMFGSAYDSINEKVYLFGGSVVPTGGDNTNIFEVYDIATAAATTLQPPSLLGCNAAIPAAYYSGFVFLFMGSVTFRYSVALNSWAQSQASGRSNIVASAAHVVGSNIYLLGGSGYNATPAAGASISTVDMYAPSVAAASGGYYAGDSWTSRAPIPSPRALFATVLDTSNLVYVIGGTGFPIRVYVTGTDDFKTEDSVDIDVVLNQRAVVPATVSWKSRYWAITFRGRITEGIARVIGFNLDYIMLQRRG